MNKKVKHFFSVVTITLAVIGWGLNQADHHLYGQFIHSDAEGYYLYLPAVMVYSGFENLPVLTKNHFLPYKDTQKIFTKYTYGVAVLQLPFYLGAHFANRLQGINPSQYYTVANSVAVLVAGCFYGVLGLFFLFKTLVREVGGQVAPLLACTVLLLGTNLLFYMAREPGMSHVYSFFLVSLLLYLTPGLYAKADWRRFTELGLLAGFIILIRPTDGLVLLYPLLYGIRTQGGLVERLAFFSKHLPRLAVALLLLCLVWLPQLYYWHYLTGDWFYYSYTHEGFHRWKKPQIFYVLAGPLNGWLTFNPAMLFALTGMPFLVKGNRHNGAAILAVFLVSLYLFASWWMWWFGGAYGYRPFVDLLPLLAVPLCFVLQKIWELKAWPKLALLALLAFCCYFNLKLLMNFSWDWSSEFFDWKDYLGAIRSVFPFLGL
ncbi:MAG: hypothetical protein H6577_15830 [Lewinellaceae bacterium]|nr:hypothetical protein [Saprospiraceae bacterium]MCB9339598.1 hypothetical protein [Lewinellaceae bacterium]